METIFAQATKNTCVTASVTTRYKRPPFARQKVTFRTLKGNLSECKRMPFRKSLSRHAPAAAGRAPARYRLKARLRAACCGAPSRQVTDWHLRTGFTFTKELHAAYGKGKARLSPLKVTIAFRRPAAAGRHDGDRKKD